MSTWQGYSMVIYVPIQNCLVVKYFDAMSIFYTYNDIILQHARYG